MPKVRRVIVEVRGGVAEVTSCPDDIDVHIVDYDNAEAGACPECGTDLEDGKCSECGWSDEDDSLVEDEGIACCVCGCQDVDVILVHCMKHEKPHKGRWPLTVDGFAWDEKGTHKDGSTEDEIAECSRCHHKGPLSDFNFPPRQE